jgi:hypothetical protein
MKLSPLFPMSGCRHQKLVILMLPKLWIRTAVQNEKRAWEQEVQRQKTEERMRDNACERNVRVRVFTQRPRQDECTGHPTVTFIK